MTQPIQIVEPINTAWTRMVAILFSPFDLKKWIALGFCAFLAGMSGGGGSSFNFPSDHTNPSKDFNFSFLQDPLVIGIIIAVVLFLLALGVLLCWVSARGSFMFLDGVVHNRSLIKHPWREFRKEALSLFWFVLCFGLGMLLTILTLVGSALLLLWKLDWKFDIRSPVHLAGTAGFAGTLIAVVLLAVVANCVLRDFVVPAMYLRRSGVITEWRRVWNLITHHSVEFILYFLFRMGVSFACGILILVGICLTCCLAAIPYVSSVVFLPFLVLLRTYPLCFLAQFGPDWDVLQAQPTEPAPPAPPPLPPASLEAN